MTVRLPRLPQSDAITEANKPTMRFQRWWQSVVEQIEAALNGLAAVNTTQDELIAQLAAAVAAIEVAQAAADAANTAAANAQATADNAQSAVDGLNIPPTATRTVTATTTALVTDGTILCDATAGAITVNLYAAVLYEGPLTIRKIDASANTVTIDANGGEEINGAGTLVLTTQYESKSLTSDGSADWFA